MLFQLHFFQFSILKIKKEWINSLEVAEFFRLEVRPQGFQNSIGVEGADARFCNSASGADIWPGKSTLLNESCSNQKIIADLLCIPVFKVLVINQGFLFQQLLFNKVDFPPTNFEAAVGLQIEAARKRRWLLGNWTIGLSETGWHEKTFLNWRPLLSG